MTKKYDWESIKKDFLEGILSIDEMTEKHGIDRSYLYKRAKKCDWERQKSTKSTGVELIEGVFISGFARDRYNLTREKMGDVLTIIDDNILIPLCNQYSRMIELEKIVSIEGVTIVSPKTGASYANPNYNALLSATKTVASLGKELGLTVSSRKRAGIPTKPDRKKKKSFIGMILDKDEEGLSEWSKNNPMDIDV